jgi:hypothetical protein
LRVRIEGVTVKSNFLADALYPPATGMPSTRPPVFLTEAELDGNLSAILMESGYLPVRLK